ncbi:hypothetical protein DFH28DRAFT_883044 [Melampsora americana]|nr:hypothetical protein DFH28DRAFT_883044 [Melampsora americana]
MDNYSTSQKYHSSELQYPDPIKVSCTTSQVQIDLNSNLIPKPETDKLSDLGSFSPRETDSMIQSAAGRSPLPSPPRHLTSLSSVHQLPLASQPRPSSPDELIDQIDWEHVSISTQSSPQKTFSLHPSTHHDPNHSPPNHLSSSPQPDWFCPSSSPTPTYINLHSNTSSVSNFKKTSFHHLQEWQKSLPDSKILPPPEATISELLGVSTKIERRLSIEDDRQSLQNDIGISHGSELRPSDNCPDHSRSSTEFNQEQICDHQAEPIRDEILNSKTMVQPHNSLTYSRLALVGMVPFSILIYQWIISNEGEVLNDSDQTNQEGRISEADLSDPDHLNHGARLEGLSNNEDSVVIDETGEIMGSEIELVERESKIDILEDQPLLSIDQDAILEARSVSIDSKIESLNLKESIIRTREEIEMTAALQNEVLKSIQEKKIESHSIFSIVPSWMNLIGFLMCCMILYSLFKFKSTLSLKFQSFQTKRSNLSLKEEVYEEDEEKMKKNQVKLKEENEMRVRLGEFFGIFNGTFIPQDKRTIVKNLERIFSYSWLVRPFHAELIERLRSKSNEKSSKVDKLMMIRLIKLMKRMKLIEEERNGKGKGKGKEEEMNDEEGSEGEEKMELNEVQSLVWEAIKEMEEEDQTEVKMMKGKIGLRKSTNRKSKMKEIKVKEESEEEEEKESEEKENVCESERNLPVHSLQHKKSQSNRKKSSRNEKVDQRNEIQEEKVRMDGRRRMSHRINKVIVEPIEESQMEGLKIKKSNHLHHHHRKSQVGMNDHHQTNLPVLVPLRSSPRLKKS